MGSNIVNLNEERVVPLVLSDDGHWRDFDKKDEFLELVNPINYEFATNPKTTTVQARPFSCYNNTEILKVEDPAWPAIMQADDPEWGDLPVTFYFLHSDGEYLQPGEVNDGLWAVNEALTLNIKKTTVLDYIKFFGYFFALTDEGSFFVIEGQNSEFIDLIPVSNQLEKSRVSKILKDPIVSDLNEKEDMYNVECDMLHGPSLFRVKLEVFRDGEIEMVDDRLLRGYVEDSDEEEEEDW